MVEVVLFLRTYQSFLVECSFSYALDFFAIAVQIKKYPACLSNSFSGRLFLSTQSWICEAWGSQYCQLLGM